MVTSQKPKRPPLLTEGPHSMDVISRQSREKETTKTTERFGKSYHSIITQERPSREVSRTDVNPTGSGRRTHLNRKAGTEPGNQEVLVNASCSCAAV